MMFIIKDILLFLTKGKTSHEFSESNTNFLKNLYLIKVGFFLILFLLNLLLFDLKIKGNIEGLNKQGFFIDSLNILLLAPILEEILFRFHLNLKLKNIIFSTIAACIFFYDHFWFLLVLILYFSILILINKRNKPSNDLIFVYISAFIFGIAHLAYRDLNLAYEDILSYIYIFTLRFFNALIYSYVFFKRGIYFSILLHFLWNFFPFLIDQLAN